MKIKTDKIGEIQLSLLASDRTAGLSDEEVAELCVERDRDPNDHQAVDTLVKANMRLLALVAQKYRGFGVAREDLIQAGSFGLIKAAQTFSPKFGWKFSTYATNVIKRAVQHSLSPHQSVVRIPAHVYSLAGQLRPVLATLSKKLKHPPTLVQICREHQRQYPKSKFSPEMIAKIIDDKLPACALFSQLVPEETSPWSDCQLDAEQMVMAAEELHHLREHLAGLGSTVNHLLKVGVINLKDRDSFFERYGLNDSFRRVNLETVGQHHHCTKEMVRQRTIKVWWWLDDWGYGGQVWLERTLEKIEILTGLLIEE